MAKIEANIAGVDDALMLDINGFAAETNATNIFIVKDGVIKTPFPDACLPGITRATVLKLASDNSIEAYEARLSISEIYSADEVFITGTMGEIVPVVELDGRKFEPGKLTKKVRDLYKSLTVSEGEELPPFHEEKFKIK